MPPSRKDIHSETEETLERSVGEMLKQARQEQGLDYLQLSEITRLQPHVLESLENEEWHTFSAPVFIKGFLHSYAKALNLDEEVVLRMYDRKNPRVDSVPRPLASLAPSRKRTPTFFVILVLLAGCAFFAMHYYTSKRHTGQQLHVVEPLGSAVAPTPKKTESPEKVTSLESENAGAAETTPETGLEQPETRKQQSVQGEQAAAATTQEEGPMPEDINAANPPQKEAVIPPAKPPEKTEPKPLVLKAEVKEKTWVKIIVDQEPPKEYVFQPGSHPEWTARDGFELFIGNAGGIALELNGKKLDNLGRHGKVIHLKLPRENERNARE